MSFPDDLSLRVFASALEERLKTYKAVPRKELLEFQTKQLKKLIRLEKQFRQTLVKHKSGMAAYKKFVDHILVERGNILAARPFFRERQPVFNASISQLLKDKKFKGLCRFKINYLFASFIMKSFKFEASSELGVLYAKIQKQRQELLEMNLPLALSRTRIFWSHTPKARHLDYMDLVQIHAMGLLVAIDKFVPPEGKMTKEVELQEYRKFRAVAIGRMVGDRIEEYSQTLLHFYPSDKRKIYRALKSLRFDGSSLEKIVSKVNEGVSSNKQTTPDEIVQLLAGIAHVSGDSPTDSSSEATSTSATFGYKYSTNTILENYEDDKPSFEAQYEFDDAISKAQEASKQLSLLEKKLFKMKGLGI